MAEVEENVDGQRVTEESELDVEVDPLQKAYDDPYVLPTYQCPNIVYRS